MSPIEIYLGDRLVFTTSTGQAETSIPDVPMLVNYSGDECGGVIALKDNKGQRLTDFQLVKVGEEKIMRFEQTVHLPAEYNRTGDIVLKKSLKFRRT